VKTIELVLDPVSNTFKGTVNVEFQTEAEAKRAHSSMMGLKIEDCVLFVKKLTSIGQAGMSDCGEVFKQLIDDKPTKCLCIKNIVEIDEIEERIDYKELEYDVQDEMERYGRVMNVVCPRPPVFGDPYSTPGFGKVFILFSTTDAATQAKANILKRQFNGRTCDALFFPEEKLAKNQYD